MSNENKPWRVISLPKKKSSGLWDRICVLSSHNGKTREWSTLPIQPGEEIAKFPSRSIARLVLEDLRHAEDAVAQKEWNYSVVHERELPRSLRQSHTPNEGNEYEGKYGRVKVKYVNSTHVVYWTLANGGSELSKCQEMEISAFLEHFKFVSPDQDEE